VTTATTTARPFGGEADLQLIVDLQNACEALDRLDQGISVEELRTELTNPEIDAARDLQLWQEADGALIGFGQLVILDAVDEIDTRLMLWVRPNARGADLEPQILDWAAERLRVVARERGKPARLQTQAREDQAEWRALLRELGFAIDRYSYVMMRDLAAPIATPQIQDGFTIRELAGHHEAEQWVEMFNLSFIDHPNHHPATVESVVHYLEEPIYRQDLNLVAVAPDGTFAGFCWALINPQDNARNGRKSGEIAVLGTRRGFRRLGLGRALLLEGLRRLRQAGMDSASLGVVANNPTGAQRLYESAGFRAKWTWMLHGKAV
jgi:mycothiol synthase